MKQIIKLSILFISIAIFANEPLLQNSYLRKGQSLNGRWHYIVDVYETGYYNYRMEPHDGTENPGSSAYFLNKKPKNKTDRVEYDFDAAPTMVVPGDWNSQNEKLFYYEGTVWYKKSFNVENYDANKRYYIHFGAVNYRADVYLNGKKLGVHVGGFTSFNFEMTQLLKEKDNFLIIKVDNKRAANEVPTLSTDWWNYGGITRDVSVYELDQTFIEDYKIQLTKNNNKEVSGYIQLNGENKRAQKVNLSIPELKVNKSSTPSHYIFFVNGNSF